MPKVFWSNKAPISLEKAVWFCWFFASSYLHLVRYPLTLQNMLFWAGIVSHSLSANQIARFFKLKKLKKGMRYEVDFCLPLKLEEISCYFGLWLQNTLGHSVGRIFYFWLVWVNTRGPFVHCTRSFLHCIFLFLFCSRINKPNIHNNVTGISSLQNGL